ncbi:MAG: hypothetical protein FWF43_04130 [Propionibacteriaceae bacterium]|nr:hypothetical protein [Propionibacteriaceae bacterium]
MRTVTVTAERSGKWWVLESQEAGAVSQCRSLAQADAEMREAIAYQLGLAEDEFAIDVEVVLPEEFQRMVAKAEALREEAETTNQQAALAWRSAARTLADQHLSVRDIGRIMGVSHQRAAQLVSS